MLEDQQEKPTEIQNSSNEAPEVGALVGFFDLLLTVDRRINPSLYD